MAMNVSIAREPFRRAHRRRADDHAPAPKRVKYAVMAAASYSASRNCQREGLREAVGMR